MIAMEVNGDVERPSTREAVVARSTHYAARGVPPGRPRAAPSVPARFAIARVVAGPSGHGLRGVMLARPGSGLTLPGVKP